MASTPSELFVSSPVSVVLQEDERLHSSFRLLQERDQLLGRGPVVLDLLRVAARRRRAEAEHGGLRAPVGGDAEVGERDHVLRLRLRAHDPLERRVARLVDRVRDRHDCRERGPDPVVAVLGLALDGDAAVRRRGAPTPARRPASGAARRRRPRGRRRRSPRPAGRTGRAPATRARARPRARATSSTRSAPSTAASATSTTRSAPIASVLRSDSSVRSGPIDTITTSPSPQLVLDAQSLLDRVQVELVERAGAGTIEPQGLRVDPLRGAVGHLFDADRDLHRSESTSRTVEHRVTANSII